MIDLSAIYKNVNHKLQNSKFKKYGKKFLQVLLVFLIAFIVLFAVLWLVYGRGPITEEEDIVWGLTYSSLIAEELNLDPEKTYEEIIKDLKPEKIRLVAYWNRIEKERDVYDFSELDYQVSLAEEAEIPYVIAVGRRTPRYPECHEPNWAMLATKADQEKEVLELIEETITRYDDNEHLVEWQIENEPFLSQFGECPDLDEDFLKQEIAFARNFTDKKIWSTESGELSFWFKASGLSEIMGTNLYRTVIISGTNLTFKHIFPPSYYRIRSNIVKQINPNLEKIVVAELQAEPWANSKIVDAKRSDLLRTMNPDQLEKNITFTKQVGFEEVYFWGVEWWYYEKLLGQDYYWERGKQIFNN